MKRNLTFVRVWWKNGCWGDYRPKHIESLKTYKDLASFVVTTKKIRRRVEVEMCDVCGDDWPIGAMTPINPDHRHSEHACPLCREEDYQSD